MVLLVATCCAHRNNYSTKGIHVTKGSGSVIVKEDSIYWFQAVHKADLINQVTNAAYHATPSVSNHGTVTHALDKNPESFASLPYLICPKSTLSYKRSTSAPPHKPTAYNLQDM